MDAVRVLGDAFAAGAAAEANCYFTKPPDFEEFVELGKHIRRCYESGRRAAAHA